MQIHNAVITGSFSYNGADLSNVTSSNQSSASLSTRVTQIEQVYATTGSNSFRATQSITGSLTVTGQIVAQTLNVQQVTSSIVYSSGSNVFGCDINSRQTFTGSFYQTGSVAVFAGNVGIGVTNPPQVTTIVGGTTSPGSFSGGNYYFGMYSGSASTVLRETFAMGSDNSYVYMQSFSSKPLYINSAGNNIILGSSAGANNVGIGISNPSDKLHIAASSNPYIRIDDTGVASEGGIIMRPTGYNTKGSLTINYSTGEFKLATGEVGNSYFQTFYTNGTEKLRITAVGTVISQNGNIVLGTNNNASYNSTCAYTLFIANAGSEGSIAQGQIAFGEVTSYGINTTRIGAAITTYYSDTYSRLGLVFKTKNTADDAGPIERVRITAMGTTILSGPTLTAGSQGTYALQIGEPGYNNLTLGYKQATAGYIQTWSSTALYLNQQGNAVYAGSVRLDTLSDQRIKDNIQPLTNSLNKVLQLNGKKFHLKDEPEDKIRYGFIAQDLEGVLDEFVINTNMKFKKDDLVVENVKSIENWSSSWSALLVEAIKEQQCTINALKTCLGIS